MYGLYRVALGPGSGGFVPASVCVCSTVLARCCICSVNAVYPSSIADYVIAMAVFFTAMGVIHGFRHRFPFVFIAFCRMVSGSGWGPIPSSLVVAFSELVPYLGFCGLLVAGAISSVIPVKRLPDHTTPVRAYLGTHLLPIQVSLDRGGFLGRLEQDVQLSIGELFRQGYRLLPCGF